MEFCITSMTSKITIIFFLFFSLLCSIYLESTLLAKKCHALFPALLFPDPARLLLCSYVQNYYIWLFFPIFLDYSWLTIIKHSACVLRSVRLSYGVLLYNCHTWKAKNKTVLHLQTFTNDAFAGWCE